MSKYVLSAFADEAAPDLKGQIAALQRNGIRYMEIRSVNGENICQTPLETVAEYKKALDAAGIRVLSVGSRIGKVRLSDDWNAHVAEFLHTLGAAKILGASKMRMFSLYVPQPVDAHRGEVIERMEQLLQIAAAAGVTLCHENEKGIYGDGCERVLDLMHTLAGRMEFIFDPANFIQCSCAPLELYRQMRDSISYFHMKDAKMGSGLVVPVGEGDGQIETILRDFAVDHEETMLTVEPHLMAFIGLRDEVSMPGREKPRYRDNNEAFDAAVTALKTILERSSLCYE